MKSQIKADRPPIKPVILHTTKTHYSYVQAVVEDNMIWNIIYNIKKIGAKHFLIIPINKFII